MTRTTSPTSNLSDAPVIAQREGTRYDRYRVLLCNLSEVVSRGNEPIAQARQTLERVRLRGIQVQLTSRPTPALVSEFDSTQTLVVTGSLEDTAHARELGFDSLFLLGRANGLRDIALCGLAQRPTYVAVDIRTLEHPSPSAWPVGEPPATYTPRGRVVLQRPFRNPPQQVLDAVVEAGQRAKNMNKIMLGARADLWRPVENTLKDYWNSWVEKQSESQRPKMR